MDGLAAFGALFKYSDAANRLVLNAAAELAGEVLDREIDIGPKPGSLRRILIHTWNGEFMWLNRWRGNYELKWPPEQLSTPVPKLLAEFEQVWAERDAFLATLTPDRLGLLQRYRDSRGSLFQATLSDMLSQGIVHSIHHRAQAINAIRRLGGTPPEVDYMNLVRQPV
jgi:uncharacterized damage-inducible protein DinB